MNKAEQISAPSNLELAKLAEAGETKSKLAALRQTRAASDARASELDIAVRELMRAELMAAGFRLHAGSEWRHKRDA